MRAPTTPIWRRSRWRPGRGAAVSLQVLFRNLGRGRRVADQEHDLVVTAIMRGDRDGAMRAMRDHIITVRVEYEMYALSLSSTKTSERTVPFARDLDC